MTQEELKRKTYLDKAIDRRITQKAAAKRLGISERQFKAHPTTIATGRSGDGSFQLGFMAICSACMKSRKDQDKARLCPPSRLRVAPFPRLIITLGEPMEKR
jgi:hypothetical protein